MEIFLFKALAALAAQTTQTAQMALPNIVLLIDQPYIKLGFLPFVSSELIRLSQLSHKRLFTDKVQNHAVCDLIYSKV